MSSIPQTTGRARSGLPRGVVAAAATLAILAVALAPVWRGVLHAALAARPHALDVSRFHHLPTAIKVHIVAALAALALGSVLTLMRKGRLFHRIGGWGWVVLVAIVAVSSLFIDGLSNGRFTILHLFTGWAAVALPLAVIWAKRRDVARHRRTMMGLFFGGFLINIFIAFIPGRTMWNLFFG